MILYSFILALFVFLGVVRSCDDCQSGIDLRRYDRIVRRMQSDALGATLGPSRPLEWGQLNILHTTDTHGWLEGHIHDHNYGADWGDWVSFTRHMRNKAAQLDVDLLIIDTGDLHDGAGLSDLSPLNGEYSNIVFENVDYDLACIGNHELGVADIAYETFQNFSRFYGERYLTTNVQILDKVTGNWTYIGQRERYFVTSHGLRILAIGVIFDFTGNVNVTKVTKAADLIQDPWFNASITNPRPVDLLLFIGHNAARPTDPTSSWGTIYKAVRALRPHTPIQIMGGHTHIRDMVVYDEMTTGMESGRYCETFGWLSISGIESDTYFGAANPAGVPNPIRPAIKVNVTTSTLSGTVTTITTSSTPSSISYNQRSNSTLLYSRRYVDWNRRSMVYHANSSLRYPFDIDKGLAVTHDIAFLRNKLNLTNGSLFGCVPEPLCMNCAPIGSPKNIYTLLEIALAETVINETRQDIPRIILLNTGVVRYDLDQGPFTRDDADIAVPFDNPFEYIPNVPFNVANQVLTLLNSPSTPALPGRRDLDYRDFGFPSVLGDECPDLNIAHISSIKRRSTRGYVYPRADVEVPGYNTIDDFGTDGDDTPHLNLPVFKIPTYFGTNASFPADNSTLPHVVDLIFTTEFPAQVIEVLGLLGANYTTADILTYENGLSANNFLIAYALKHWQAGLPNCPVGQQIGT